MEYVKNHFQDVCDDVVECTILDQKNQVPIFCGGVFFQCCELPLTPLLLWGISKTQNGREISIYIKCCVDAEVCRGQRFLRHSLTYLLYDVRNSSFFSRKNISHSVEVRRSNSLIKIPFLTLIFRIFLDASYDELLQGFVLSPVHCFSVVCYSKNTSDLSNHRNHDSHRMYVTASSL